MTCEHKSTVRIGEIGGRFGDEWCRECGALKSWDNYVSSRVESQWVLPAAQKLLAEEQLVVACRNIGFDLTCGACAMLFYTGYTGPTARYDMMPPDHSPTCKTEFNAVKGSKL